ncbi:MAG: hypothetical protein A4E23_00519 [Methanomethylovorans sp. PtaU1.Bin073]|nr:MAG: hypothetical protein A4E23_00519 [Methanomethylovorans sp. PtaU1.Bin073]
MISFLVRLVSSEEDELPPPPPPPGPIAIIALEEPGEIVMAVRSISESLSSMSFCIFSLKDMIPTTAPTPMTIPIMVSQLRILLCSRMERAILR